MDWIHSYNKRSNENSIRGLEPTVSLYFLSPLEFPEELLVIKGPILCGSASRALPCPQLRAQRSRRRDPARPCPRGQELAGAWGAWQGGTWRGKASRGEKPCKVHFAFIKLSRDWKHATTSSWQRRWNTDVCWVWKPDFMASRSPV